MQGHLEAQVQKYQIIIKKNLHVLDLSDVGTDGAFVFAQIKTGVSIKRGCNDATEN